MKQPAVMFQVEGVSPDLLSEMLPLLVEHWKEVAHFPDIPLNPDFSMYKACERQGILRCYTARKDGVLIGYAIFFVRPNAHYQTSLQANQDIVFISKEARGRTGMKLIQFCDEQLKAEGVQAVYQHVKVAHNFGPMLERMGYELVDLIYARRLDKEV